MRGSRLSQTMAKIVTCSYPSVKIFVEKMTVFVEEMTLMLKKNTDKKYKISFEISASI
jgi:hypothetical protein